MHGIAPSGKRKSPFHPYVEFRKKNNGCVRANNSLHTNVVFHMTGRCRFEMCDISNSDKHFR